MIDGLLSYIAPHPCFDCGKLGSPLCDNCKYNIVSDVNDDCIACGTTSTKNSVCSACRLSYSRGWCVGVREATLRQLIDAYKFERARAVNRSLAKLLDDRLPILPEQTVVVPIPTVPSHIRERGYDHALLLAKIFAKSRGLKMRRLLYRKTSTRQREASRETRMIQAQQAFELRGRLELDRPHLIIDDVITTGATVEFAAKILKDAGVHEVWVAAVARQPLD